jgi:hypothetical protein
MNTAKLREWLEILGIFGIVASLIFVGLEMRQSQRIALSAAYQARADSSMTLRMAPLESETLQSAMAKVFIREMAVDQLTPEEQIVLRGRWNSNLVYLENMHYQYLSGFITEEHWQTNRAELTGMFSRNPQWRSDMVKNCAVFRDSFCAEIKAAVERIKSSE